jgi:hypothetical protein
MKTPTFREVNRSTSASSISISISSRESLLATIYSEFDPEGAESIVCQLEPIDDDTATLATMEFDVGRGWDKTDEDLVTLEKELRRGDEYWSFYYALTHQGRAYYSDFDWIESEQQLDRTLEQEDLFLGLDKIIEQRLLIKRGIKYLQNYPRVVKPALISYLEKRVERYQSWLKQQQDVLLWAKENFPE